jgi:hypothetical protein
MLPEITTASIEGQRKEEKEKICIAIISPNEMSRAFQTHRNIGIQQDCNSLTAERRRATATAVSRRPACAP